MHQIAQVGGVLIVTLNSGIMIKIQGAGGAGQNMLAVTEEGGTITGVSGFPYWLGTQVI